MDRETLNEMGKLKFASRKAGGTETGLVKQAGDADYAVAYSAPRKHCPTSALVLLATTLRDKFGLLAAQPVVPMPATPTTVLAEPAARYMLGARS